MADLKTDDEWLDKMTVLEIADYLERFGEYATLHKSDIKVFLKAAKVLRHMAIRAGYRE